MRTEKDDAKQNRLNRRNFLKLAGVAAASGAYALSRPPLSHAHDTSFTGRGAPGGPGFWKKVRQAFILDPDLVYLNIGTTGAMPARVVDAYTRYNRLAAARPGSYAKEMGWEMGNTEKWGVMAGMFGCDAGEIVFTRNTTDGMDTILHGLQLREGDEILVTHHEHISALAPLRILRDRYGAILREVEIPTSGPVETAGILAAFRDNITDRTRAIVFSHITYKTGMRLPAKAICGLAREYGLISLVDGAHAAGMIALDFHDMGCDFYAASGHKWQCGPPGTGFLYIRNHGEGLPPFWPQNTAMYASGSAYPGLADIFGDSFENSREQLLANPYYKDISNIYTYGGQFDFPARQAMLDACLFWETIGRNRIESRVYALAGRLKHRIKKAFGGTAACFWPDNAGFHSGLTAFNPFPDTSDGDKIKTFVSRLKEEYGYHIRYTSFPLHIHDPAPAYALRISTHLFHSKSDIRGLVDAMADLYRHMAE